MILPYDEAGEGPPVVLLHAGVCDRRMWDVQLRELAAAGYRALAFDLPGFGDAPPNPEGDAPWADVVETLDALAISTAALVGNSFGGGVALRAAVIAPERISRLVLLSALEGDRPPSPSLAAAWEAEEGALERGDLEGAVQAVLDAWTRSTDPAGVRDAVAAMQRRTLEQDAARGDGVEAAGDAPADPLDPYPDRLRALAIPTLVAAGEHDMPDFLEAASELADAIPGAQHVVIAGAGHLASLQAPEAFGALLLEFLGGD